MGRLMHVIGNLHGQTAAGRELGAGVLSLSWRGSPRLVVDYARKAIRGRREFAALGAAILRTR